MKFINRPKSSQVPNTGCTHYQVSDVFTHIRAQRAAPLTPWSITLLIMGLFGLTASFTSHAQEFAIKKVELTSESVIIHYDLIDTIKARTYVINVYSSNDNFATPLVKVKGDAGLEVKPGVNKKIIWNSKEELAANFTGDVELEVRGKVYIPFVRFDGFQQEQVFKRGKPKTITWSGGTRQNILNFAIYKGDQYIDVIPNVANTGSYDITLPTSIKPGKGYSFMVADSKNKDQVMRTSTFRIKRKIPLILKGLPIAIIGALVFQLTSPSGSKNVDEPPNVPANP